MGHRNQAARSVVRSRTARGFTLIELMITVAVVAILAAIAYPAYTSSIIKGKRAQGRAAVLELMQQQERYLTQSGSYLKFAANGSSATDSGGAAVTPVPFKMTSGDTPSNAAYKLGARVCTSGAADSTLRECVIVFAVPQYADPAITELTIASNGAKSCTVGSGSTSVCW